MVSSGPLTLTRTGSLPRPSRDHDRDHRRLLSGQEKKGSAWRRFPSCPIASFILLTSSGPRGQRTMRRCRRIILVPMGGELRIARAPGLMRLSVWLRAPVRSDWRGWRWIPPLDVSACRGKPSKRTGRGRRRRRPSSPGKVIRFWTCAKTPPRISPAASEGVRWIAKGP